MPPVGDAVTRLAVLASGRGTILEAMVTAGVPVGTVVADRPCRALEVAAGAGIEATLVARSSFDQHFDRVAYTKELVGLLERRGIDLVAMAGFMTVLAAPMFDRFDGQVLNTHPSLLPAFPGAHAVRDALAFGVKITGCTVHVATVRMDDGPILAQEAVRVLSDDSEKTLHERIKAVERVLYPNVVKERLA
jgi:phosphoribosylglycinamide formyltransferase-1